MPELRVVFMGTPDFAVPTLQRLIARGHEVCGVYTQADKPQGRGHRLTPPAVKVEALRLGLPVFQPDTLKDPAVIEDLRALAPQVIVVAAYGKLLPEAVLCIPPLGCVNVHGSLLPKYRGAAPIQWAVINGEKTVGVTTMFMEKGLDTGGILLQARTPLGEEESAGALFDRLKDLGADLLIETLDRLSEGTLTPTPQDDSLATYAPMLTKEMSRLDFTLSAKTLHDRIRGLDPWPCAAAMLSGKRLRIFSSRMREEKGEPGTLFVRDGALCVYCGEGALELFEVQPENGRRMSGGEYLRGHPITPGSRLE